MHIDGVTIESSINMRDFKISMQILNNGWELALLDDSCEVMIEIYSSFREAHIRGANWVSSSGGFMEKQIVKASVKPVLFTVELAAMILSRVEARETIQEICQDKDMPSESTVFCWIEDHSHFRSLLTRGYAKAAESLLNKPMIACQPPQRCGSTSAGCELVKGHDGKHVLPGRMKRI